MEQSVGEEDVLQGEQARAISLAAENLATKFGKPTNGTHKVGISRVLLDGSKLAVAKDVSDSSSKGEVTILCSVFAKNSEVIITGSDGVERKEPREERQIIRIVFKDGQIIRFRKGRDTVDEYGCSEPVEGSEGLLLGPDLDTAQKAIASLGEILESESETPSSRAGVLRRFFIGLSGSRPPNPLDKAGN